MPENYICKECNYASDKAGFCPYCDMPLETLDPTKIDETTGAPSTYNPDDIGEVEKQTQGDVDYMNPNDDKDELEAY